MISKIIPEKASARFEEAGKLLQITQLIARRFYGLASQKRESREFFTELYVRHCNDKAGLSSNIPCEFLDQLFPGIGEVPVQTYAILDSHRTFIYSKETGYLLSPLELQVLSALVKLLSPRRIFEMGTYRGWTIANLALNSPVGCQITTLDIKRLESRDPGIDDIFERHKILRIQGDSQKFDFSKYKGKIDFIFVDACHSLENVTVDTKSALSMLSSEGTVVWHDYNSGYPGVIECLNDVSSQFPIRHIQGTNLAIYSRSKKMGKDWRQAGRNRNERQRSS